ncbi:MAG: hypothetical protein LBV76_00370 [Deltaproteobacteria bacterium]|nr:hypothetical protein [Deltaproteobacteria bacterium]
MENSSFYTRKMLLQYGRQLVSSRRLARYHQLLGAGAAQADTLTPDEQRRLMVERITREVVDNLIFTGSDNPVVQEVRSRLDGSLGESFIFHYPPGELDFRILRKKGGMTKEVSSDEKHKIMGKLVDITRQTVSETML